MPDQKSSITRKKFIIEQSNQCVSCGLCLPHCPTYRLLKSESDSPRGRIVLMNGVAAGKIPLNARFIEHMDRCLTCRACEKVCPNNVSYGRLIDETRALIIDRPISFKKKFQTTLIFYLQKIFFSKPQRLDRLRFLFIFMQSSGFLRWMRSFQRLKPNRMLKIIANLPVAKIPYRSPQAIGTTARNTWQSLYPVKENKRGDVALFLGCVARLTDTETLNASIYVLNRLGYSVHIPAQQTCCGAIYQHSGHVREACSLAEQNKMAFSLPNVDAIITTASGCGAQLTEANVLDRSIPVLDINQFLASYQDWESIELAPLPEKILIHDPCTLRNILHGQTAPYSVISRIPNAEIVALEGNEQCCGAAGTYFLDQADISDALLENKLNAVTKSGGKLLLTSNVGCSMFFVQAIRERNLGVEVLHPVVLLARQMGWQPTV